MTRLAIILAVPALLLSGCDKGVELKNASVEDVAKATREAHFIKAGQWTTTSEIVSVDLEGMPAEGRQMGAAMSKAMVGRKNSFESCVTEEESRKPAAGLFAGGDKGSCTYDSFSMSGGTLKAVMSCKPAGGPGAMTMAMDGNYGDEAYTMNVSMKMVGAPGMPGSGMTMKAKNSGKRTGECKKG